jgi:hypothetical protein
MVSEAANWVKNAKVLVFGMEDLKPEEAASWKNPITLHTLNVHHVKPERLIETCNKASKTKATSLAKQWIAESTVKEPSFDDIAKSASIYLAFKQIVKEENADAVYVPWCGVFTKPLQAKLCNALARLADDGIPSGCWRGENLLPLLILHAVTHKPVFVCEVHRKRGTTLELRHCFSPTKLSETKPVLRPWRNMSHTVTAYCQLPKGTATLLNSKIGDKIAITKADVLDCKDLEGDNCRITINAKLPNKETLRKLQGQEFALVYGDHTKEAEEVAKRLGIQVLN